MIKDVITTPLNIINIPGGDVMHAMKASSVGYVGFGEAYFSKINNGAIKAWKRHKGMTLNLIVPAGKIRFVLFDDRNTSNTQFQEFIISRDNYCRLTVPPMIWVGFQGLSDGNSILLNVANIEHNIYETDRKKIEQIEFNWNN
jgi:dTDP-4-dehydrorhamnose 3,5-epimerase